MKLVSAAILLVDDSITSFSSDMPLFTAISSVTLPFILCKRLTSVSKFVQSEFESE